MDQLSSRLYSRSRVPSAIMLLMIGDILAVMGALILSLWLRYDHQPLHSVLKLYVLPHSLSLAISLALYIAIFAMFRLYRYAWRFASLDVLRGIICAGTISLMAMVLTQDLIDNGFTYATPVLIVFWMTSILLVGGTRVLLRIANIGHSYGRRAVGILKRDLAPRRVVILGGGSHGARVLNALREDRDAVYDVVGFLDDQPRKCGVYIRDVKVLGPLSKLYGLLADRAVDEVLIALPQASGADIREHVMACRRQKVPVKVIPAIRDVIKGRTQTQIEDISVEDLLRRPPVRINIAEIGDLVGGKRVLVTGAGGSIGSELCRQIIALDPTTLILLGHGENSIHGIHQELCEHHPAMVERVEMVIASVADEARINQVFSCYRPDVVFHAAAHKHVPIMEDNVLEAVQNNVIGTEIIAEACGRYGIEHMVMISSDKAVSPASVMGATKWLCEEIGRAMVSRYRGTTYVIVRFGNVLGSRGSVVPLFHEQIKSGGPVTVTHPEMTRYFMSIPEAVQLVLQAGALGKSGELYVLDMGQPVRILDLAHDMIRLCGHEPDRDIKVSFTGCRPGEKLHEGLIGPDESMEPAFCKGLSVVRCCGGLQLTEISDFTRHARQIIVRGDETDMHDLLGRFIPSFASRTVIPLPSETADPAQGQAAGRA